ncbi:unnamed protein product, partial [Polarella glacialis]
MEAGAQPASASAPRRQTTCGRRRSSAAQASPARRSWFYCSSRGCLSAQSAAVPEPLPTRRPEGDAAAEAARPSGSWIYKRSAFLGEWRRRYAWIEDGELRFANSPEDPVKLAISLTADATLLTLLGKPDAVAIPPDLKSIVSFAAEDMADEMPLDRTESPAARSE